MWSVLALDPSGLVSGKDGAPIAFADPEAIASAAARAEERPVLETRLATGERVALAFEPGHVILVPLSEPVDVENLARVVSHDLRAPLRAIDSFSHFLIEDAGALPESAREDLVRLRAAAVRLEAYVNALVDWLRAGRRAPGLASLREVGQSIVERFSGLFSARGGSLVLEGGDAWVTVAGAALEEQLARLVENVLVHHPGVPHARIAIPGGGAVLVADDGPGLSAEERARPRELLRRFGPRRPGDDRAGAGLAIVERAVQAWGGSVSLEAAPEGGLLVRMSLPLAASERRAA